MNAAPPPVLALTPGEPAGVGPDLALQLAQRPPACALVLIADPGMLARRARELGLAFAPRPWPGRDGAGPGVYVLPVAAGRETEPGRLDAGNARYVLATLEAAVAGCLRREFDALVTGPVHKGVINDAGIPFSGHTEFLARAAGTPQVVMMLVAGDLRIGRSLGPGTPDVRASLRVGRFRHPASRGTSASLRVALATTHLPLAEVPRHITRPHLTGVIRILHRDLQERFAIPQPRILVCGLNPHAGESGHLGREEIEVIAPVITQLQAEGLALRGPVPADTAFLPAPLAQADAVLAMYHDQGLPVLKHYGFGRAVNVTLGLPFARTSVDHGTALDLAGTGRADPGSLLSAVALALDLSRR